MDNKKNQKYFEVGRALHRGGLSIWLNRRTLLPMAIIPIIVTFLTVMFMRGMVVNDVESVDQISPFMLALMQIPSDFVVGIYASLIIFIIMSAPYKKDKDSPVVFSLNLMEHKHLLISGAMAHVIFGYFANGVFGVLQMMMNSVQSEGAQPQTIMILPMLVGFFAIFYGVRFAILPILLIAKIDVISFFKNRAQLGFSMPIFSLKLITSFVAGIFVLLFHELTATMGDVETAQTSIYAMRDLVTSIASVLVTIWCYASLSIGIRQMIERNRGE